MALPAATLMEQPTPTPGKVAPQRIISRGPQKKGWRISWREVPLLVFVVWGFFYLPTQGSSLQRARLGYVFLVLGILLLCLNLLMVAKRRSVVPVVPSLFAMAAVLALTDDWGVRAGIIACVVAADSGVLWWARSRHP